MSKQRSNMKVTQIYLTERQRKKILEISQKRGVSMSEVIRRILDDWIDGEDNEKSIQD